jgi:hypothetical protein
MEEISYDSYTLEELGQAKEMTLQSLHHYKKLIDDQEIMATLKEGDKMALNLCYEETKKEIECIEEAMRKK